MSTDPTEFPAPTLGAPPSLAHVSIETDMDLVRSAYETSFQEKSRPSRSVLESVVKSANRASIAKGVKDFSLSEKNFHTPESSITDSVKGISLLQSMLRSLFPMIAHNPEPGRVNTLLRD